MDLKEPMLSTLGEYQLAQHQQWRVENFASDLPVFTLIGLPRMVVELLDVFAMIGKELIINKMWDDQLKKKRKGNTR